MRKLRILVDMDNIVVDLTQKWLDLYNRDHGDNVTIDDLKTWHIANHVRIKHNIHEYLYSERFFLDVEPMDGALNALKAFHDDGHHVVIVSAPSHPGNSASDKITWIREKMPWFNKRDIILGHHKHFVKGDVFIDDSPDNIRAYRAAWPDSKIMTIAYPFNRVVSQLCDVFAEDYKKSAQAWLTILDEVDKFAERGNQ
jgi:5'(3')-deoxyribonucleotidase